MSVKKATKAKELLDSLIDKEMPALMDAIMADKEATSDVKAARVGLASTAQHHLKLLRGAME